MDRHFIPDLASLRTFLQRLMKGALFWKYVALIVTVMGSTVLASGLVEIWFTYQDHRTALYKIQQQQAEAAASRISLFMKELENQLGWMTHLSWDVTPLDQRELDARRLLKQVPAITELVLVDANGREQLHVSRHEMDVVGSNVDVSADNNLQRALDLKVFHGPIYFRRQTEPYMKLAMSGLRRDTGVAIAEVNLTYIWDVISQIHVGQTGRAYVVDELGKLIAHPEISLVLRNTDLSHQPQVVSARAQSPPGPVESTGVSGSAKGEPVLAAFARAAPMEWLVFAELPLKEADAPLYAAIARSVIVALGGLVLAVLGGLVLARHLVVPIQALSNGATLIGNGDLSHRINIKTGDELEALGRQFNIMAVHLQSYYANLEEAVTRRTKELQDANEAKSRLLAVASHDLRQPLHALTLLAAQFNIETKPADRLMVASQIEASVLQMNELFNALLDISKLDAGTVVPIPTEIPIAAVLSRIETAFAAVALDKGLHFSVVQSSAFVRSDAILLERLLLNLVSNAIRYTPTGGVIVGCRRQGAHIRVDVCDTGIGISPDHQTLIFSEFYRVPGIFRDTDNGLGIGLAIVKRLATLLDHRVSFKSIPDRGSRFSVIIPLAEPKTADAVQISTNQIRESDPPRLVVIIDDDEQTRTATAGLLQHWGCNVLAAATELAAADILGTAAPSLIIADFHLEGGTGVKAIASLRKKAGTRVPAILITGDLGPEPRRLAKTYDLKILYKPITPAMLRSVLSEVIGTEHAAAT